MKRFFATLTALVMLLGACAFAEETEPNVQVALESNGVRVLRCEVSSESDTRKLAEDYPDFECDDDALAGFLRQNITEPLLALRNMNQMCADDVYAADAKDYVRVGFMASMDFDNLLSVEASVGNRSADRSINETLFFWAIVDLQNAKMLTIYDLFNDSSDDVDAAVREAVFSVGSSKDALSVTDASQVPAPDSYYLASDTFRCLYASGKIAEKATVVDIPWDVLQLSRKALIGGVDATQTEAMQTEVVQTSAPLVEETAPTADPAITTQTAQLLMQNDWAFGNQQLRFATDGTISSTNGAVPVFSSYTVEGATVVLNAEDRSGQRATASQNEYGLLLSFEEGSSDYTALQLVAVSDSELAQTEAPIEPQTTELLVTAEPLQEVVTPTPMPVAGTDADIVTILTQGLWKRIGTDGTTYYQFTADGKLLKVEVSDYSIADGVIASSEMNGSLEAGGSAFTITQSDGTQVAYVLNRNAFEVTTEELVTPSPSPSPTPTPSPTATLEPTPTPTASPVPTEAPTPTPEPTATPSPEPTPTLSPYEQAVQIAPSLAALGDANFERRQTLKVYSAPDEGSYRDSKAQVTTDETVAIYGVEGNWVLVGYQIGNGSKGRIGYIDNSTLADAQNVAQLALIDVSIETTKDVNATDDPINGKGKLFAIKKGTTVKLLAFLGSDWAYVETTYKDRPCRAFIPRSGLMNE